MHDKIQTLNLDKSIRFDITCKRGDTFIFSVGHRINGVDQDISASTYILKLIKVGDALKKVVKEFSAAEGNVSFTSATRVRFREQIFDVPAGKYYYDIQRTYPNGDNYTAAFGILTVNQDQS